MSARWNNRGSGETGRNGDDVFGDDVFGDGTFGDGGGHGDDGVRGDVRREHGYRYPGYDGDHGESTYGPDRPLDDRTGNEIVNDPFPPGLTPDELALRRLLHGAVDGMEPADGALDQLRRAVPERQARKRQAVVGAVAAALLIGTAIPAFLHVANTSSSSDEDRPAIAGHGRQDQGGTGVAPGAEGGGRGAEKPSGRMTPSSVPGSAVKPSASGSSPAAAAAGASGTVGGPAAPGSPVCDAAELGVKYAKVTKPDADGKVYGTFRVANVSHSLCQVSGAGKVNFQALGAADASRISVVDHASGDPAAGLPDPSQEATGLVLKPAAAYEVKFAWVPSETCPRPLPTPAPSTSPATSPNGSTTGTGGTPVGAQTQLGGAGDPGTPTVAADGKVAVTHVAEPGAPSAEATIPNACAGTIYRTGVLAAPAPPAP
ncbi:hypothetical protein ACGFRG_06825 [Streptomyces sp. NPDC048696]|uniref:hypothetical protein n=1 Tax=Streptomyces sp. NPDC048696 TaxID=3365585 RepID=UPI003716302D